MRVVKVLNNSLIMAIDDLGQEVILFGKGIGYKKSIGYQLQEQEIQKIFVLKDRGVVKDIIRLASEVGEEYFNLTKNVITYATEKYNMDLMDHLYLALTDHFAFAARRVKENMVIRNFYMLDLKKFNPQEYDVGQYAVEQFREQFGIELPEGEAGNIAFHFINAQQNNPYGEQNRRIDEIVRKIFNIIKYQFQLQHWEETTAYSRMITHLRLFAQRLLTDKMITMDQSDSLYEKLTALCAEEYQCAVNIGVFIQETYHREMPKEEKLYLMIYIHQLVEEEKHRAMRKER